MNNLMTTGTLDFSYLITNLVKEAVFLNFYASGRRMIVLDETNNLMIPKGCKIRRHGLAFPSLFQHGAFLLKRLAFVNLCAFRPENLCSMRPCHMSILQTLMTP